MIVVTGATGAVGGASRRELAARGVPFRMVVRDAERAPACRAERSRSRPTTTRRHCGGPRAGRPRLHGLDALAYAERLALHRSFIDVAVRRRVGRVVYLSFVAAGPTRLRPRALARRHRGDAAGVGPVAPRGAERDVRRRDRELVRRRRPDHGPGRRRAGQLLVPAGARRGDRGLARGAGPRRPRDRHDHDAGGYSASRTRRACDRRDGGSVRYEPLDREDWIAYRRSLGRPEWSIEAGISFYDGVARGEADVVSDDYRGIDRPKPMSIRDLLEQYRDELPLGRNGST